jgi:glyoxylase I family protein
MAEITGGHHIALTVADSERSAAWYTDLLGMQEVMRHADDDVLAVVLAHPGSGWLIGLRQYLNQPHDHFDEFRTGMDHLAFGVSSRAELEAWVPELESRGVTFSPIADTPIGSVVVFRDPDGIQLEFWLPARP